MVRTLSSKRRDDLLSAALKLFVEYGVQNTSTAKIAAEAGTAAGTLFLYFPTKQDLINALVLKIGKEQSDAVHAMLEPSMTAYQAFLRIWNGSIRFFMDNMDAYAFVQQIRDSGSIPEQVVQESNLFFDYYYQAVQKGLQEGSVKEYPAELIGGALYQQVVGVMNLVRMQPDPAQREDYIRQGFEIFWNGIRTEN